MEQADLLGHGVRTLESLKLRYFVTGSVGTIFFGEPRFTNDIDVVVDLNPMQVDAWFAAPEDLILKKRQYYQEDGSDKHLRDITGILKVSGDQNDAEYVTRWSEQLGVADIWRQIQERLRT